MEGLLSTWPTLSSFTTFKKPAQTYKLEEYVYIQLMKLHCCCEYTNASEFHGQSSQTLEVQQTFETELFFS